MIDGKTKLLGLLGNPVEHSLSPVLHTALASLHQENYAYLAFRVEKEQLKDAVNGAYALGAVGLNVTVPYKKEVMQYLCGIDEKARLIGAVNTLVRTDQGYRGYNTDMPGLYRAMKYDGVSLKGKNVVVIGAGGVANAVLGMLLEAKAGQILILNRTGERAERLAERFRTAYAAAALDLRVASYDEDYLSLMDEMDRNTAGKHSVCENGKWIAIQATSVGMSPKENAAAIEDADFYQRIETGYDLIFNPYETKFMKLVRAQGGKSFNGLRMLLFQGIYAYELWNRISVSDDWAEKVLWEMKKAMGVNE